MTESLIVINEIAFPLGSARGITLGVSPIAQAFTQARDQQMGLVDLSHPRAKQYKLTLSCDDQESPTLADANIWPGNTVNVSFPGKVIGSSGDTSGNITGQYLVGQWQVGWDEWAAQNKWTIDLEQKAFSS